MAYINPPFTPLETKSSHAVALEVWLSTVLVRRRRLLELFNGSVQAFQQVFRHSIALLDRFLDNLLADLRVARVHKAVERILPRRDQVYRDVIQVAMAGPVDNHHLLLHVYRRALCLL